MTKKDVDKILELREDGWVLRDIAKAVGVSHETVRTAIRTVGLPARARRHNRPNSQVLQKIIYPNIARWLEENRISVLRFSELLGMCCKTCLGVLYGKHSTHKKTIDKVLAVTGMTYEEAFKEERNEEE